MSNKEPLSEEQYKVVAQYLGWPGVMLSGSKNPPKTKFGTHLIVWNGNIIVEGYGKVWFGDFDITKEEDKLKALSRDLGKTVYVLREMDGRFDNEANPKIERAVYTTQGDIGVIGADHAKYYHRDPESNRIVEKPREKNAS